MKHYVFERKIKNFDNCKQYANRPIILFTEAVIRPEKYAKKLTSELSVFLKGQNKFHVGKIIFDLNKIFSRYRIMFIIQGDRNALETNGLSEMRTSSLTGEIAVCLNQEFIKENIDFFLQDFYSLIGHELIHRAQFIERNYIRLKRYTTQNTNTIEYISDNDELMSYAWQISEELRLLGLSENKLKTILKNRKKFEDTSAIFSYFSNIIGDLDVVRKKFLKYIVEYLFSNGKDYNF